MIPGVDDDRCVLEREHIDSAWAMAPATGGGYD